jgi:hypothetical protein
MEAYSGNGNISPHILDLSSRWRWVVSFVPRSLYLQVKSRWYSFDRRLGGPQNRSGNLGEEKIVPTGIRIPDHPTCSPALCHWAIQHPSRAMPTCTMHCMVPIHWTVELPEDISETCLIEISEVTLQWFFLVTVSLFLIKRHHTSTFGESLSCSVTSWGLKLPHTWQLCLVTVTRTLNVASSEENAVYPGKSHPLQCGKAFLKQTALLNHDLLHITLRTNWSL